ncbi:SPRY domain containing SOCS box protein 1 [Dissostichus eleginoides]|uniref:SPRY domain containing SOCS box protein 1 n=1 Tax=Dissostichus eleginoides TaxID=100907 RepID=A0AAD9FDX6_DISEL|nr:SPRY domain containing SOCS box protein 1 [Dissostichus eleginoides]
MGRKCSLSLLFLILFFSRADALFAHGVVHCQFTSPDDFVYLEQIFFNKVLQIQYNSTLGKYTGYREKTKEIAEGLNKNPKFIKQEKINELKCKNHIALLFDVFLKPEPRTDRESENNKIAVGTAGLLLGPVFFVAGLIYYKKKTYVHTTSWDVLSLRLQWRQSAVMDCAVPCSEVVPENIIKTPERLRYRALFSEAVCTDGCLTVSVAVQQGRRQPSLFFISFLSAGCLHILSPRRHSELLSSCSGDSRSRWSSTHCSPSFLLSACKQEVTRSPVELSTDGVRAEMGVKSGLHVWEVLWSPNQRGSHAVIGISRQSCPLRAPGYEVLIGRDPQSWGWELKTNQLWHAGQSLGLYPGKRRRFHPQAVEDFRTISSIFSHKKMAQTPLPIPERVLLVLDADAGTLGFVVDGSFLCEAFKDLPRGVELFPAVSSVRGGASIRLRYLNGATCVPPALMALCGLSIRQYLGQKRQNEMEKLPLPPRLQHYLLSNQ